MMKTINKVYNNIYLVVICFAIIPQLNAQNINLPLNQNALQVLEANLYDDDQNNIHTSIKPYNHFEVGHILDSLQNNLKFEKQIDKKFTRWLYNSVFNDHFLQIGGKDNEYSLILNPLMDIRAGSSSDMDALPFINSRGIQVMGRLGKTFTFYTDLYENQARYPGYINNYINNNLVVPGQGFPKNFDSQISNNDIAYDYAYVNGNITYQPNKFFNFQLGHGKHFIGDGYRSLFLSDNAFNYPYLKITTSFWKLKYMNLFTQMRDIKGNSYGNADFQKKYVMSHYLSINVTKKLNIGFFESVVYQDSTQTLDINYLNPVILYRPIEFAIGSTSGNVLIGLSLSYKIKPKRILYGQLMLDEFKFSEILKGDGWWANKYAFQIGFKSYDSFMPGLKLLTELNYARPYTYAHETSGRSFGHYNQPIAHTLGANFIESVNLISYQNGRWFGELELMYAVQGRDSLGTNVGTDVFLPYTTRDNDYGNETLQGVKSTTLYADFKVGYVINPKTNLRAELGVTYRSFNPEEETPDLQKLNTTYFNIGIRTALNNKYYDF